MNRLFFFRNLLGLLVCDNILLMLSIFTSITLNGCGLTSYTQLILLVNIPNTCFWIFQSCSIYIILLLSIDRFLAVQIPIYVKNKKPIKIHPLPIIFIISVLLHMSDFTNYHIICEKQCVSWMNVSTTIHTKLINTKDCKYLYIDYSDYKNSGFGYIWWIIRCLLFMGIPLIAIIFFNGAFIINLIMRPIQRHLRTIYVSVYIATSFVICFIPITIHGFFFDKNIRFCKGPPSDEVLRLIANILLIIHNILHGVIVIYNYIFAI